MQKESHEELIRRYLEGEMSVAEEHDFLIEAAVDRDLRLELSAQQTIDRAFAKDRPAVNPEQYGLLQQNVQGFLAATPSRRGFPSLRTGLITGLLILVGSLGLLLLPVEKPTADRARTAAESPDVGNAVEPMRETGRDTPAAAEAEPLRSVASPETGAAAVEQGRLRRSGSTRTKGSPTSPDRSTPPVILQETPLPARTPSRSVFTDLESMVRIGPETKIGPATTNEPDSIRLNLDVEWDLPE